MTIRQHTGSVLSLLYGIRRDIDVHGYRSYVIYVTLDTVLYCEVTVYGVPQVIEEFRFLQSDSLVNRQLNVRIQADEDVK